MELTQQHEQFVQLIIRAQAQVYAYILSLTADPNVAEDVLQETNLRLLRQEEAFDHDCDFLAWAIHIAHYQVLTSRKRLQRERLRLNDQTIELIAADAQQRPAASDERMAALRSCLSQLKPEQRSMIEARYAGTSVQELAHESSRPIGSVSQALYRIRKFLAECVQNKLGYRKEAGL